MKRVKKKEKKEIAKKNLKIKIKNGLTFDNLKKGFFNSVRNAKHILLDNKLVLLYIIGATINGLLLRALTIGKVFSFRPLIGDLIITLLFVSIYFLVKKKYRFWYLILISLVSVIVNIANIIYYYYYSSFISITFFSFALANHETGDSNVLGSMINPKFFLFFWLPVALTILYRREKKKDEDNTFRSVRKNMTLRTIYGWTFAFLLIFLFSLKPVDFGRLYNQWNREYLVSRFGVYVYQINDMVKSIEPKMATLFGKDKANRMVNEYYEENGFQNKKNKYTNLFKGKNVIAIHAESMQRALIGLKINGQEVTPNLNKLANSSIYFDNFYSQVSFGTSSDTEFTLATSVLPVSSGTVFINYSDREYMSFYNLLKENGYYTFSMHANNGEFWNRNIMHKSLGYEKFYDKASYKIDEEIGFGLSDKSFITQSVDYIKQINNDHKKFYGTLITLSNHTPFDYNPLFGQFDVTLKQNGKEYPYMKDTKLGNYFVSAHYADAQLGLLVKLLEDNGIMDDTIILIYGDHDARISTSSWNRFYNYDINTNETLTEDSPNYQKLDYYWQEMNRRVPVIIYTNDKDIQTEYSKKVETVMGMYDLAPTLGNMLGVTNKYALGSDIMNKKDNLVPFPNGNFVTNYVYYNDNKEEYKLLTDKPLSEDYINENKAKTDKLIDVSNSIIVYDYFGNKFAKAYEEE